MIEELSWIIKRKLYRKAFDNLYGGEIKRRICLLKYLHSKQYELPLKEIIANIFLAPQYIRGKSKIKKIEKTKKYNLIYLKGYLLPLYFPISTFIYLFYSLISDMLYEDSWHYYETKETKVNPDDIVVDCGAAEGLFSFVVAPRCKKVYAIEPLPRFADSLKLTFKEFKNVEILDYALSDKVGREEFIDIDVGSFLAKARPDARNLGKKLSVKVTTLDELFYKKNIPISYIKADLEGSDLVMLKGARKTIKKYKPRIAITTYHKHQDAQLMIKYLKQINPNYKVKLKGVIPELGNSVMLHAWVN